MQSSHRDKARFYHELGRLVAGGIAIPQALETLSRGSGGTGGTGGAEGAIPLARRIAAEMKMDGRIEEAFRRAGLDTADCAAIEAAADSGRIESVCEDLSLYHTRLASVRSEIIKKSLYPIFMFLFTPLALSLPRAVLESSPQMYIHAVLAIYVVMATVALVLIFAWSAIVRGYRRSSMLNHMVSWIPLVGGWLDFWSGARFASVFSMYLRCGGSLLRGLTLAGEASHSVALDRCARRAVEAIRDGATLTEAVGERVPLEVARAIKIGEETGTLDIETHRAAQELEARAFRRLDVLSEWIPRLLYIAMVVYVGYSIVSMMNTEIFGRFDSLMDF